MPMSRPNFCTCSPPPSHIRVLFLLSRVCSWEEYNEMWPFSLLYFSSGAKGKAIENIEVDVDVQSGILRLGRAQKCSIGFRSGY